MSRFYPALILPKLILPVLLLLLIPVFAGTAFSERTSFTERTAIPANAAVDPDVDIGAKDVPAMAKGSADTYMIAGYDDESHYAGSILLVRLDREHSTLRSVQIGGDCYVRDPICPDGRLGSAFAEGYRAAKSEGSDEKSAGEAAIRALVDILQKTLGVKINGSVCLGFDAFSAIVDRVDGVNIVLPEDYTCSDGLSLHAGSNHLDGRDAIRFLRFGEADKSVNPQKLFLTALLKKVKKEFSITKAISLGCFAYRCSDTDLGLTELLSLVRSALAIKISEARIAALAGVKTEVDGVDVRIVNRNWARDLVNYYLDAGQSDDAFDPGERMTDPGDAEIEEIYRGRLPGMNGFGGAYNIPSELKTAPFRAGRKAFPIPMSLLKPPNRRLPPVRWSGRTV